MFCYENNLVYPASALDQKFENSTSLLTIANENKSHYVYIKDFNRFVCDKTKSKKNMFASIVYNVLVVLEHKLTCLKINGKKTVKLRSSSMKLRNYFKQLAVTFKIYTDFESLLKGARCCDKKIIVHTLYTEKYQKHISCSFAYKVICVDDKFGKPVVLYRGKNAISKFIEVILQEYYYCKKVIKNILVRI